MANLNIQRTRDLLQGFEFQKLFIEELGWSNPAGKKPLTLEADKTSFHLRQISQLAGVIIFEIDLPGDEIPPAKTRASICKEASKLHHENLIIFVNKTRTKSLWYWVKREGSKRFPREHYYLKGQPGDLFLSKLSSMVVDISELDESGEISVVEVAKRLKQALDVEKTTKKFFLQYDSLRLEFVELIEGIKDDRKRKWYASVLLNRLMFIYFLQEKFFLDNGNKEYLLQKLSESKKRGKDLYYKEFLKTLFFEGFAKPEEERSEKARKLLGHVKYLNGGLFIPHSIEMEYPKIGVPDRAFENLFELFRRYSWNLNDTPGGQDDEINPDVLGYIFEQYINQKEFGAYYTRPEITEYLSERTISGLILEKVNERGLAGKNREFTSLSEVLVNLNAQICQVLLKEILPGLKILDPACGSGAFLVAAMKWLINIYSAVIGRIEFLNDPFLTGWLKQAHKEHPSISYFIKKRIITHNLFGVDIMEEAAEIAKLRLFLALVAAAQTVDQLEPLPNVDFNIMTGNSLVGLMHVNGSDFDKRLRQGDIFKKSYDDLLKEKNHLIDMYRDEGSLGVEDLRRLRDSIQEKKRESVNTLDEILLDEFAALGVKYEEATWDDKKHDLGKPKKRGVTSNDLAALTPFHWGFEFDRILGERGGFDVIITNPPWEILKPQAKEFFANHSELVTKKKMDIKSFEKEMARLLKDEEIRDAWLDYLKQFPHVSAYFRSSSQYKNQISVVNGKKAGTDINLYKLFVEKCFHLLRPGGECGIVIPSGIYTDLGTKQLREMLFGETKVTGLFCFENRKGIFENVDSRFKFVVLTFARGFSTKTFPAAFMRHDVEELDHFPNDEGIRIDVDLVRRLSPDSLSVMEFKDDLDVQIAEKALRFPLLGEDIDGKWRVRLTREFDMTNDSSLFRREAASGRLPLYEGKMIWQFDHEFEKARYWVEEKEGRKVLLGKHEKDTGQKLDYQSFRLGFRDIAASTNERSLVSAIVPPAFHGNKIPTVRTFDDNGKVLIDNKTQVFLCGIWNSFILDWLIRIKVTTTLNFFYIYQLPVPRLTLGDRYFKEICDRSARLICTTPEFDDLAKEVGLGSHKNGVTDPSERAKLRAELDGIIAHLYGLTEEEFAYILTTFPIVEQSVKDAALQAYRDLAPKTDQQEIEALIRSDESNKLEFKSTLRWDLKESKVNKALEDVVVKTVAGFMNSGGGTLLIGVEDNKNIVGLQSDYNTLGSHKSRDGFENHLTTLLLGACGKDLSPLLHTSFRTVDGKEICKVVIAPSLRPVFLEDGRGKHLYIRTGNSTRELDVKEAVEYVKGRWK